LTARKCVAIVAKKTRSYVDDISGVVAIVPNGHADMIRAGAVEPTSSRPLIVLAAEPATCGNCLGGIPGL
jgi:hypothetical protein